MTQAAPPWLNTAYKVALVAHALFLAAAIGLAVNAAFVQGAADSAPAGGVIGALLLTVTLSPAMPSAFALLSWNICRKRGWTPSPGHKGLAVAAAVLILVFIAVVLTT